MIIDTKVRNHGDLTEVLNYSLIGDSLVVVSSVLEHGELVSRDVWRIVTDFPMTEERTRNYISWGVV